MTLEEALKQVPINKARYFRWKYGIYANSLAKTNRTEEEFLKYVNKKSMMSFEKWEKTPQYAWLISLMLKERYANDFLDIYTSVVEKAKDGDEKAINTILKLKNEIEKMAKIKTSIEEDDGLDMS